MTTYYADSSVLIKRHIPETGSDWTIRLTDISFGNRIVTASITQIEGLSALNRRVRESTLSATTYSAVADNWLKACTDIYQLVLLSPQIVTLSRRFLEKYPLRAYDAVQLASASYSSYAYIAAGEPPLIFLASDRRLLDAARGEGFEVDDPNQHP